VDIQYSPYIYFRIDVEEEHANGRGIGIIVHPESDNGEALIFYLSTSCLNDDDAPSHPPSLVFNCFASGNFPQAGVE